MGRHSSDSDSDSDSSGHRRRRREKHSKKDKEKKTKRDKGDKKEKKGKREKRSRTPEKTSSRSKLALNPLQDFDIDAALAKEEEEIFQESVLQQQHRPQPDAGSGALTVINRGGVLTLGGNNELIMIAPDANSDKIRAYAQVARESRRVHVSHIPRGMDQDQLKQMFTVWCSQIRRQMIESEIGKRIPDDCIVDIDQVVDVFLNNRGNIPFAFIELSTDDMCTKLITGDLPVEFPLSNGGTTKVGCRRPRDYKPMMTIDRSRIMMVGIENPEGNEATYRRVLETLGEIKGFAVIPKRGYYVEYADPKSGDAACKALHGEQIGDRIIAVQPTTEAIRAWFLNIDLPVTGLLDEGGTGGLTGDVRTDVMGELLNLQIGITQAIETYVSVHDHLKIAWPMILPTRILCLLNAFDRSELEEADDSYDNLVEDISDEVEKYGRVKRLIIPRHLPKPPLPPDEYVAPKKPVPTPMAASSVAAIQRGDFRPDENRLIDPTGMSDAAYLIELARWQAEVAAGEKQYQDDLEAYYRNRAQWDLDCMHPVFGTPGLGRCYVEYETVDEAEAAQAALAGKLFGGRTVVTSFLFEDVLYPPPEDEDVVQDAPQTNTEADATAGPAADSELQQQQTAEAPVTQATEDID